MASQTAHQETSRSYLEMSDEEMLNAPQPTVEVVPVEEEKQESTEAVEEVVAEVPEEISKVEDEKEDGDDDEEDKAASKEVAPQAKAPVVVAPAGTPIEAAAVNYEAEYKRMLAPFKANGKDIAVDSIDDAISLMQMGANYNKKMAGLKPNMKMLKMLENSGLLSEEKISFLIDLDKKNPAAISKLMKDSGLDPMDMDAEKADGYKPTAYSVDDREIELDTVLDEIQGTPSYTRTLDIVSSKWDSSSKQVIAGSPQLLKVINDHVQSGIYDQINAAVESERVYGRLNGLSDIEAYRQVGDAIQAKGGFGTLGHRGKQEPTKPVIVTPKPSAVDDDKLREKRKAAGSTKSVVSALLSKGFNPLMMSDDEFNKSSNQKYL